MNVEGMVGGKELIVVGNEHLVDAPARVCGRTLARNYIIGP